MNNTNNIIEYLLNHPVNDNTAAAPDAPLPDDAVERLNAELERAGGWLEKATAQVSAWRSNLERAQREGRLTRAQSASILRSLAGAMEKLRSDCGVRRDETETRALNDPFTPVARQETSGAETDGGPEAVRQLPVVCGKHVVIQDLGASGQCPLQRPSSWQNSLGMIFLPVPGVNVLCCIWPTRVRDYAIYAKASPGRDCSWEHVTWQDFPVSNSPVHPVTMVNLQDAKAFCEWLTEKELKEGRLSGWQHYRLPLDHEWSTFVGLPRELGTTPSQRSGEFPDHYPWGRGWPPPLGAGNYADNSAAAKLGVYGINGYRDGYVATSPVGSFPSNRLGLYDLGGNVWEWCDDWMDERCGYAVRRGGSWLEAHPIYLLSSSRKSGNPDTRDCMTGFRVVLDGMDARRLASS